MVGPQPEQPGDDLGAEAGRWLEARCQRAGAEVRGGCVQAFAADQRGVQLGNRDGGFRVGWRGRRLAGEAGDEVEEVAGGQRVVGAEVGCVAAEQAARGDEICISSSRL